MTGEKGGFMPQAEVMGPLRNTQNHLNRNGIPEVVYTPRKSRVVMGVNRFGDIIFIPLPGSRWDQVDPALLPHFWRGAESLFDQRVLSYENALRHKTTTVSRSIGRGDRLYRPDKKTGFMFPKTSKDIAKEREIKELKRRLLAMGIDVDKLYLLLHTAAHNQTLLERHPPDKKKKNIVSKAIKARRGDERYRIDKNLAVSSPFITHEKRDKAKIKTTTRNVYSYKG